MQSQPIPSATTPKTLVIFSHPQISQSRIHARLLKAIENVPGITVRHLDALYPDGKIDVKAEQLAVEQADNIVFQFPLYWYSFPALLKAYLDEVCVIPELFRSNLIDTYLGNDPWMGVQLCPYKSSTLGENIQNHYFYWGKSDLL